MKRIPTSLAVSLIALAGAACGPASHEQAPRSPAAVAVRVVAAAEAERAERLEAGGVVVAQQTATISSRVVAPVAAVAVRAGDRVRAGDVLVRLDVRDLAAQSRQAIASGRAADQALAVARSAQAAAAADLTLANAFHTRITQLRERNSATAQELDEAEARRAAAAARLAAAEAGVEQATAQAASAVAAGDAAAIAETYGVVRAPFAGLVTERLIDPGTLATPGLPLVQIDGDGPRRVDVRVDESRAAHIRPGDRVIVFLDSADRGTEDAGISGVVREVARAIAADQRAFTVKVELPPGATSRTGTFARVRFDGDRRRVIVIPAAAVRRQGQVSVAFVVSDGIARVRLLQTGPAERDEIEVVAGLDAGEMVVVSPPPGLADGHRVTIEAAPAAGAGR